MKKLLVVLLTVLFVLTGCGGGGTQPAAEEVVYVVGVDAEPATMNPDAIADDNVHPVP